MRYLARARLASRQWCKKTGAQQVPRCREGERGGATMCKKKEKSELITQDQLGRRTLLLLRRRTARDSVEGERALGVI